MNYPLFPLAVSYNMGVTIEAIKAARLRDKVKVMISGASATEEYAKSIGEAFAPDSTNATHIARQLMP